MFEDDSAILEAIATRFDESSLEYRALRHASIALWYVLTDGHDRFVQYVAEFDGPLTEEQKMHFRQLGIDPDADIDE
jgi:hypothetical protein